jgi:cytidine deaminase
MPQIQEKNKTAAHWEECKIKLIEKIENKNGFESDCKYIETMQTTAGFNKMNAIQLLTQWVPAKREKDKKNVNFTKLNDNLIKTLVRQAQIARTHAYCPYSNYPVGAALLTNKGDIFTGCNIENMAYGSTICAERTALVKAMSEVNEYQSCVKGEIVFIACAIVLRGAGSPCGACRQMLNEVNPKMMIYMADIDGIVKHQKCLEELLILAFGPNNLSL